MTFFHRSYCTVAVRARTFSILNVTLPAGDYWITVAPNGKVDNFNGNNQLWPALNYSGAPVATGASAITIDPPVAQSVQEVAEHVGGGRVDLVGAFQVEQDHPRAGGGLDGLEHELAVHVVALALGRRRHPAAFSSRAGRLQSAPGPA